MSLRQKLSWLYRIRDYSTPLEPDEYLERFGIEKVNGSYRVKDKNKLDKAYSKAWENRNFEIDKFWTRAAYFWGFIVLIFGGYVSIVTSEHNQIALKMRLDFCLLLLGFLFSLAWYLVIRGSKGWQENWEAHIDWLEFYISGHLYKTVYYSGKRYYSVSKLNEVMALAVILLWSGLLANFIVTHFQFTLNLQRIDWIATLSILATTIFAFTLRFGYCVGNYKTDKHRFIDRWE